MLTAYFATEHLIGTLWLDLSKGIVDSTVQRTMRYVEPAGPYVAMTRRMVVEGHAGEKDEMQTLDYFRIALEANPDFTWASLAEQDGRYLAAYRAAEGGIRATWREQKGLDENGKTRTRFRDFELQPDGSWKLLRDELGSYDPRLRAWYQAAIRQEGPVWSEPFLFASKQQPGFIYSQRLKTNGKVRSVLSVEYEIAYLSKFLAKLNVGQNGRVYVVTRSGLVLGHPSGEVTATRDGKKVIADAASHPDPMLAGAWAEYEKSGVTDTFIFGKYLAMAERFPAESGTDWVVLVVAPESDFFGEVKAQGWIAIGIAAGVALLAVLLGAIFSNRASNELMGIAEEMHRIGQFELTDRELSDDSSLVREINQMSRAADSMKSGLRSFAKYVPTALVRELIRSGEEAVLGGRNRRITVLFADIADFTPLCERMDPVQLVAALGEFLQLLSDTVQDGGGTVDKYMGDEIMAFWGAPRPCADHAAAACKAALNISVSLARSRTQWQEQGKPAFRVRIGINSGLALVGNIGSPDRLNYTAIGDAVNLASRLEQLGKLYGTEILVGSATAEAVSEQMFLRPVDWVCVKGKEEVVLVHELLSEHEQADDRLRRAVEMYAEALQLYRNRKFAGAAEQFERAKEAFGGEDTPCDVLAKRCRKYAASPPDENWNGAYIVGEG